MAETNEQTISNCLVEITKNDNTIRNEIPKLVSSGEIYMVDTHSESQKISSDKFKLQKDRLVFGLQNIPGIFLEVSKEKIMRSETREYGVIAEEHYIYHISTHRDALHWIQSQDEFSINTKLLTAYTEKLIHDLGEENCILPQLFIALAQSAIRKSGGIRSDRTMTAYGKNIISRCRETIRLEEKIQFKKYPDWENQPMKKEWRKPPHIEMNELAFQQHHVLEEFMIPYNEQVAILMDTIETLQGKKEMEGKVKELESEIETLQNKLQNFQNSSLDEKVEIIERDIKEIIDKPEKNDEDFMNYSSFSSILQKAKDACDYIGEKMVGLTFGESFDLDLKHTMPCHSKEKKKEKDKND